MDPGGINNGIAAQAAPLSNTALKRSYVFDWILVFLLFF